MNDWQSKAIVAMVPVVIAVAGWSISLENRIQVIDARQSERTSRFDHLEQMLTQVNRAVMDPAPKPETKIAIESLRRDMDNSHEEIVRLNERLNNLHNFLLQTPPFKPQGKRGTRYDTPLVYPQSNGIGFP